MKQKIQEYITLLEKEKNIKIIYACETGSRAWGFASPDSDFDIRMIYVHQKDWYLSLIDRADTIERMYEDNDIDITGWDLKKTLNLLRKSNASLLERIQSPVIYTADEQFLNDIRRVSKAHYSRIATVHHYVSMAKKFVSELKEGDQYKLKKFFYALRSAAVCRWIMTMDDMPPIEFNKIYPYIGMSINLITRIEELIQLKSTASESYMHSGEELLIDFMDECITEVDDNRNALSGAMADSDQLNVILRKYITKYDH